MGKRAGIKSLNTDLKIQIQEDDLGEIREKFEKFIKLLFQEV